MPGGNGKKFDIASRNDKAPIPIIRGTPPVCKSGFLARKGDYFYYKLKHKSPIHRLDQAIAEYEHLKDDNEDLCNQMEKLVNKIKKMERKIKKLKEGSDDTGDGNDENEGRARVAEAEEDDTRLGAAAPESKGQEQAGKA